MAPKPAGLNDWTAAEVPDDFKAEGAIRHSLCVKIGGAKGGPGSVED